MTDEEKEEYRAKLVEACKKYNHIDYEDEDDLVELMLDATFEEMTELIPNFNADSMTARQRLLTLVFVKDLYDNREKYQKDVKAMRTAVSSILLKEIYGGGT